MTEWSWPRYKQWQSTLMEGFLGARYCSSYFTYKFLILTWEIAKARHDHYCWELNRALFIIHPNNRCNPELSKDTWGIQMASLFDPHTPVTWETASTMVKSTGAEGKLSGLFFLCCLHTLLHCSAPWFPHLWRGVITAHLFHRMAMKISRLGIQNLFRIPHSTL